jgi:hypothetical protein
MTTDQSDTTQTITVNMKTFRETEKNKNLQEPETSVTTYRANNNWKQVTKGNTLRVGKLDVKKIEERNKEFQRMEKESRIYKAKKVY